MPHTPQTLNIPQTPIDFTSAPFDFDMFLRNMDAPEESDNSHESEKGKTPTPLVESPAPTHSLPAEPPSTAPSPPSITTSQYVNDLFECIFDKKSGKSERLAKLLEHPPADFNYKTARTRRYTKELHSLLQVVVNERQLNQELVKIVIILLNIYPALVMVFDPECIETAPLNVMKERVAAGPEYTPSTAARVLRTPILIKILNTHFKIAEELPDSKVLLQTYELASRKHRTLAYCLEEAQKDLTVTERQALIPIVTPEPKTTISPEANVQIPRCTIREPKPIPFIPLPLSLSYQPTPVRTPIDLCIYRHALLFQYVLNQQPIRFILDQLGTSFNPQLTVDGLSVLQHALNNFKINPPRTAGTVFELLNFCRELIHVNENAPVSPLSMAQEILLYTIIHPEVSQYSSFIFNNLLKAMGVPIPQLRGANVHYLPQPTFVNPQRPTGLLPLYQATTALQRGNKRPLDDTLDNQYMPSNKYTKYSPT